MGIGLLSCNPSLYSTKRIVSSGKKRGHERIVLDHLKYDIKRNRLRQDRHTEKAVKPTFLGYII